MCANKLMVKSIVFFSCMVICIISYWQKTKEKKPTATIITKTFDANQNPLKDTAFLKLLAKMYGDTVQANIDSLSRDSNFLQAIGLNVNNDYGEFASSSYKMEFPLKPLGWTSDYENLFSTEQVASLDSLIIGFENQTSNQINIVTIDSTWASKEEFDNLILKIHNDWGIGIKGVNNGILIGISKGFRKIRISNGSGIVAKISDAETKNIINFVIIPAFKKGNYFEGTRNGLIALMKKLR